MTAWKPSASTIDFTEASVLLAKRQDDIGGQLEAHLFAADLTPAEALQALTDVARVLTTVLARAGSEDELRTVFATYRTAWGYDANEGPTEADPS